MHCTVCSTIPLSVCVRAAPPPPSRRRHLGPQSITVEVVGASRGGGGVGLGTTYLLTAGVVSFNRFLVRYNVPPPPTEGLRRLSTGPPGRAARARPSMRRGVTTPREREHGAVDRGGRLGSRSSINERARPPAWTDRPALPQLPIV